MVRLTTFTVQELTEASNSKEATVRTVLRRFDSTKLVSSSENHHRLPGGQVKTYRLSSEGRQTIKNELKKIISSFVSYTDFKERETQDQEFSHVSLNAAIEGLGKLKSKRMEWNSSVKRVEQTFRDLERAKLHIQHAGNEKNALLEKISVVIQELQNLKAKCNGESVENKNLHRYAEWEEFFSSKEVHVNAAQNIFYSKAFLEKEIYQKSSYCSNYLSVFRPYEIFSHRLELESNRESLNQKIHFFNNVPKQKSALKRNRLSSNTLIAFKENIRHVASSLEVIKNSAVSQAMPEIYVCSAMRDKFSRSLATHIQGRFDTFLDVDHATKRIEPASAENGDIFRSNRNVVVIITLNSSGADEDLRNAISKIKRIQSQCDFGVVVADQSEGFDRLEQANISRENYWPKARDNGFEAIMQYADE
jgi:DNA-binding PadR family transcriptional regulator